LLLAFFHPVSAAHDGRPIPPAGHAPQPAGKTPIDATGESLVAIVHQAVAPERGKLALAGTLNLAASLSRQLATIQALAAVRASEFPPVEHLVALRPDGSVLWQLRGESGYVRIEPDADAALYEPGSNLVLVHNHPTGVSLSLADLENLAKPGVAAMIVVGHDSSVYLAERGAGYDGVRLAGSIHTIARRAVSDQIARDRPSTPIPSAAIDSHLDHLVLAALHEAGLLRYQAILATSRRRTYDDYRRVFNRSIEAARGRIRAAMRR
jgi:hypothetical protein